LLVNLLPLVIYLVLLSRLVERYGRTDWGKIFVMACACFGTFLTTFAVTFNNHSLATCCVVFALYPALKILDGNPAAPAGGSRLNGGFVLAGFFTAFAACCDLPAAAFAVALLVILLRRTPGRTLAFFVPAALIPAAAFFLT